MDVASWKPRQVEQGSYIILELTLRIQIKRLDDRVGVDGFFIIVRNNKNFVVEPHSFFTSPAMEDYLPICIGRVWESNHVASQLEAFAIAGCSLKSAYATARVPLLLILTSCSTWQEPCIEGRSSEGGDPLHCELQTGYVH